MSLYNDIQNKSSRRTPRFIHPNKLMESPRRITQTIFPMLLIFHDTINPSTAMKIEELEGEINPS